VATDDPPKGTFGFKPAAVSGALATGQGTPTPLGVAGGSVAASAPAPARSSARNAEAGAEYVTQCAARATGQPLPAECSDTYAIMQQLAASLLFSPQLFTAADAAALASACSPPASAPGNASCAAALQGSLFAYADLLQADAPADSSSGGTCEASLGPNVAPLTSLLSSWVCLDPPAATGPHRPPGADPSPDAGFCAPAVALAMQPYGIMYALINNAPINASAIDSAAACAALAATGCCGTTFLEVAFTGAQMTCRNDAAAAITRLAESCDPPLPPPCSGFAIPAYAATSGGCEPVAWPEGCAIADGECPDSSCELACAIAHNSPPPDAFSSSEANYLSAPAQHEPVEAAAYLSACLEIAAGAPFSPNCAATYGDFQAMLAVTLNAPNDWSQGDNAALDSLCEPVDGAYSCVTQLSSMTASMFANVLR
jgi:hypothetical protein